MIQAVSALPVLLLAVVAGAVLLTEVQILILCTGMNEGKMLQLVTLWFLGQRVTLAWKWFTTNRRSSRK